MCCYVEVVVLVAVVSASLAFSTVDLLLDLKGIQLNQLLPLEAPMPPSTPAAAVPLWGAQLAMVRSARLALRRRRQRIVQNVPAVAVVSATPSPMQAASVTSIVH